MAATKQHQVFRTRVGNRLAYYREAPPDREAWDRHWSNSITKDAFAVFEDGNIGFYEEPFATHLPKQGRILEAGCGTGRFVMALRVRGYEAEGIEWSRNTVAAVNRLYPDLPVTCGDVTQLPASDGTYAAYVSLGVIEHSQDGPEQILKEARRVLDDNGVAFFSVPQFHLLRRLKARLGWFRNKKEGLEFYQYAFTTAEAEQLLSQSGFKVVDRMSYDVLKGLRDESRFMVWLLAVPRIGPILQYLLNSSGLANRLFGHMILFVCRKQSINE